MSERYLSALLFPFEPMLTDSSFVISRISLADLPNCEITIGRRKIWQLSPIPYRAYFHSGLNLALPCISFVDKTYDHGL
jgi:hypothetical protein